MRSLQKRLEEIEARSAQGNRITHVFRQIVGVAEGKPIYDPTVAESGGRRMDRMEGESVVAFEARADQYLKSFRVILYRVRSHSMS